MMAGADGQVRFHVRDAAGNVIFPALTRVQKGPLYKFDDAKGGTLHEEVVYLSNLTFVEDWYQPPYDPKELRSEENAGSDKNGNTEIISFRVAHETRVAMEGLAHGMELHEWMRKLVHDEINDVASYDEIYPGAGDAVAVLVERYREIQSHADRIEERCPDLSLYLRSFRAQLDRLADKRWDPHQSYSDVVALWRKIRTELVARRSDRALVKTVVDLAAMFNATADDVLEIGRKLRGLRQ